MAKSNWRKEYHDYTNEPFKQSTLSPEDELKFATYLPTTKWFQQVKAIVGSQIGKGVSDDEVKKILKVDSPSADYDYRGAYEAGVAPQDYSNDPKSQHWGSSTPEGKMLKAPWHPTTWMEYFMRQYGVDPVSLGLNTYQDAVRWEQENGWGKGK